MSQSFNNQTDTTRDIASEVRYPLCTKFGLRINPGPLASDSPGIPFEALRDRLQAVGKWGDWLNWGGEGVTCGPAGIYPWDVEQFLAGQPNND